MCKAIIDTCFFEKFYKNAKLQEDFYILINEAGFELLLNPYVFEYELSMKSYIEKMINDGFVKVCKYDDFITEEHIRLYYTGLFVSIYNEFYENMKVLNPKKAEKMVELENDVDVFTKRAAGASLGDVHIILMALFMEIPIILSEDSDMAEIYRIARNKFDSDKFKLMVYKVEDVIEYIKGKAGHKIIDKELRRIKRAFGK